ncbi:hemerythrin domain-containing protein [Noviherbaspirillum galbum]|uniref:Hemerythrin domain-containing protein n=1 Tax=Noviherbaspirillum galbum TaxID=2709383 RepID=A0A6B3SMT0_9BURK|nr:hemerythrin domain-containing protein [Noviherbaspirillum galbum]NEX62027.1 hemerythrin domain-containing protein [Noviherbaspirillum galbum]
MEHPAAFQVIRVIQHEHQSLAAVIKGMRHFVRVIAEGGKAPDLKVFRAMLLYISEYPEQVHHPKEDMYLFAPLRKRTNEVEITITTLEAQHQLGEQQLRDLSLALMRYEFFGDEAFKSFHDKVEAYASQYFEHMTLEEKIILPAAQQSFTEQDWQAAAAAFSSNADPLADIHNESLEKLFTLICRITPAPLGLGEPV